MPALCEVRYSGAMYSSLLAMLGLRPALSATRLTLRPALSATRLVRRELGFELAGEDNTSS